MSLNFVRVLNAIGASFIGTTVTCILCAGIVFMVLATLGTWDVIESRRVLMVIVLVVPVGGMLATHVSRHLADLCLKHFPNLKGAQYSGEPLATSASGKIAFAGVAVLAITIALMMVTGGIGDPQASHDRCFLSRTC